MTSASKSSVDFGAPLEFGMHHFYVDIPAEPRAAITIYEDFGFDGNESKRETIEARIILARDLWSKIRDDARRDFNSRLKPKKQSTGSWSTGKVKLDRFLGRELCVLAWAAEHANPDECAIICQKWLALRPEERWWLYSKTSSEAGAANDIDRGWRKALHYALADGASIAAQTKARSALGRRNEDEGMLLFESLEGGG